MRTLTDTYESAIGKLGRDRELSKTLASSSNPTVLDTSWRIARCCDDENLWFVNAPMSGWLHGRYWKCRSKLCSFCLSHESRRRRKTLQLALQTYPASTKRSEWRFLTLTIENPHLSIANTRAVVNRAWSKLRKRVCFAVVQAGCKSEEFTLTRNGYHYHIHSLLHAPNRIDYQDFRRSWTECVESSGGESQRLFGYDTIDGYLIAQFKQIRSVSSMTNELCKYITKSKDFNTMSNSAILEFAQTKRWHRMFELIGSLRQPNSAPKRSDTERAVIVHKRHLSDGFQTDRWYFEKRRTQSREFQQTDLEAQFGQRLWTLDEIRAMFRASNQQSSSSVSAS